MQLWSTFEACLNQKESLNVRCYTVEPPDHLKCQVQVVVYNVLDLIVAKTILLIVIGSLHAHLSLNPHTIMWVSNYRCPV